MRKEDLEKLIGQLVKEKTSQALREKGLISEPKKTVAKPAVNEAVVAAPSHFIVKTEKLSAKTKQAHEALYKKHLESFNKTSIGLDSANKHEAGSFASAYRALKMDECTNLNSVKLHELYFNNISDLASQISLDSIPYIKLSRDFGTFENWQYDFIACAMSAREGWAITVYEPYKNVYMNICVDGNDIGVPVGCVPVLVMDMWSHAFFKDYEIDKKSYLVAMMKEINWDVVEARMVLAEKSELNALYKIRPMYNEVPNQMLGQADINAPVDNVVDSNENVPPTTPAKPEERGF
jgi:Fe-Mn family superoxide dismutase